MSEPNWNCSQPRTTGSLICHAESAVRRREVLEVGAGIGANTPFLDRGVSPRWLCRARSADGCQVALEPETGQRSPCVRGSMRPAAMFEGTSTVRHRCVYRRSRTHRARSRRVECGGDPFKGWRLTQRLSPAHQWLFSPLMLPLVHHRRYDRRMLRSISPACVWNNCGIWIRSACYFFANQQFLRQSVPTNAQIRFWDRYVVPASRVLDRCLFGSAGKSIVGIWRREPG